MAEMSKFCMTCGSLLGEDGVCPECGEAPEELIIPEVKETAPDIKAPTVEMPTIREFVDTDYIPPVPVAAEPEVTVSDDGGAEIVYNAPPAQVRSAPQRAVPPKPADRSIQPTGFALTLTQAFRVIKYFFSKNVLDAVTAQYREKLNIWAVLLTISSLVSALSMTVSYGITEGRSLGAGSAFVDLSMNNVETFIVALAISIGTGITYSLALMFYFKAIEVETRFKPCANLVMSAYIPITLMHAANIISFGYLFAAGFGTEQIGFAFFAIMLFIGVRRITGGKKPLWSFILMLGIAAAVAIVVGMIVSSPIIVTRALMEMAQTPAVVY